MAKVTAPLLSFGASGTIAGVQTYSKWRGVPYARQRVIPANPNSPAQQQTRNAFSWLNNFWKLSSSDAQAPWDAYAAGQPLTGRNALISKNNAALRTAAVITDMVFSPGALGGLPVAAASATVTTNDISIAVTAPALPTGWTIVQAVGLLIKQQDPQTDSDYSSSTVVDAATPFVLDFPSNPSGNYVWAVWFKFLKPTGQYAYSPSYNGVATVA